MIELSQPQTTPLRFLVTEARPLPQQSGRKAKVRGSPLDFNLFTRCSYALSDSECYAFGCFAPTLRGSLPEALRSPWSSGELVLQRSQPTRLERRLQLLLNQALVSGAPPLCMASSCLRGDGCGGFHHKPPELHSYRPIFAYCKVLLEVIKINALQFF